MARTALNPAFRFISGRLAGYVFRHQPDGRVTVAQSPLPDPNRQLSPAQLAQVRRFKDATTLCWRLLDDPATRAAYEQLCLARGPLARLHTIVISDILKSPVIRLLDLSNYHGSSGDTIRVMAEDSLAVARLSIAINDLTTGLDVETATKVVSIEHLASTVEWRYTARISIPAGHATEVRVTACDLAGNQATTADRPH